MTKSLNTQMVRAMIALTLIAFAVMFLGSFIYYAYFDNWLYPNTPEDKWTAGDFVILGLNLSIGLIVASLVGWRLALAIVRPLKAVASAARSIADGNFSTRAETIKTSFAETENLIADFNVMASRLESAEAELSYSNSAIAHELRTPLTILRGRLQGLKDGLFEPGAEVYDRLITHVDDLTRVVEDLRTLGLSNAGRLELKLDETDLGEEVEAVVASLEQDFANAGNRVELDLDRAVTFADRGRVRQALFAILDNSRRYAPQSKIVIATRRSSNRAVIRCSDTGPGLPAGSEERAFERFWRGDESRARASGGSGLGLSVVRAIARAHGGDAIMKSSAGTGTSIEIWLPAIDRPTVRNG